MMTNNTLFNGSIDFTIGVAELGQLPAPDMPEIAFAGRSNVGKSSLINALTGRKALARTSHTPGRTQQLNYFNVKDLFYLVDMPGYGYAKVSKSQKASWDRLIKDYLRGRPSLRAVLLLIDSRHGLKEIDQTLMKMLDEAAVSYRVVFTKTDKVKSQELSSRREKTLATLKKHAAAFPGIIETSSHKSRGLDELQEIIATLVA